MLMEMRDARIITFSTSNSHNFTQVIKNNTFKVHIIYCPYNDSYIMNVDKYQDKAYVNIINGVALTTGVNLFQPFKYLGVGSLWLSPVTQDCYDKNPTSETLVNKYILIWSEE